MGFSGCRRRRRRTKENINNRVQMRQEARNHTRRLATAVSMPLFFPLHSSRLPFHQPFSHHLTIFLSHYDLLLYYFCQVSHSTCIANVPWILRSHIPPLLSHIPHIRKVKAKPIPNGKKKWEREQIFHEMNLKIDINLINFNLKVSIVSFENIWDWDRNRERISSR